MLDFLDKFNFTSIAQIWQILLVLFIVAIFSTATKVVGVKQLTTISFGFIFNFIYIVCDFLSSKDSLFLSFTNTEIFVTVAFICDIITPFCFYTAFVSWYFNVSVHPNVIKKIQSFNLKIYEFTYGKLIFIITLSATIILLSLLIYYKLDTNNVVLQTLRALYHMGGTLAVSFFFLKLRKTHKANSFIWIGFFIWAIIQCLFIPGIINKDSAMFVGYTSSSIAKILIIVGMFYWYVAFALESAREAVREQQAKIQFEKSSKFFANILAVAFHELNFPLRNLGKSLEEMYKYIARDARVKYREVENNYELVRTVITLAKNSYSKDGSVVDEIDFLLPIDYHRIVRVNNLLAIAIRSIKRIYKSNVEINTEYGSNCYIECLQAETIQVFINLIKNAIEAYGATSETRRILVRSYVNKNGYNGNKAVVVEIQDFASGISEEHLVKMWDSGFTTKEIDSLNAVRGQGLFVVKEFIDKIPGATINVSSKIEKNEFSNGSGTVFTIMFPKKELPEPKQ
jgi:signal transduction histidine kinase